MSLYANLKNARTEEDVKDIYIKALGLKNYSTSLATNGAGAFSGS